MATASCLSAQPRARLDARTVLGEAGTVRKTKITVVAAVAAALVAGCGGGAHPGITHASARAAAGSSTSQDSGVAGVQAGPALTAACTRFRNATIVMLERGPTDAAALRRYGLAMRHLGGALTGAGPGPERVLVNTLVLLGAHALATAAGQAPKGLIAAYNGVRRDAGMVGAACPRAGF